MKVLGFGNVRGVDMAFYSLRPEVIEAAKAIRDDDKFTFVFVGRIVRDKGINELVAAFKHLIVKHPESRLILVGPYEDDLDPVASETRVAIDTMDGIEAVGPKFGESLLPYYAASDCFVFPSYREGFPNTVLEAGALGLASIVTDINGSREIIEDGVNGIIVSPQNEDALYEAMLKMVEDTETREKMAGIARKMIYDRFERGFVRKCLFDYYDEIMR